MHAEVDRDGGRTDEVAVEEPLEIRVDGASGLSIAKAQNRE
jgi:formate dehydrogenase assembly factor FdhD